MKDSATSTAESKLEVIEAESARWGLSTAEWKKYLDIKKGPRGLWSPNIDPIAMLALGAKTDTEMRYYATLYAHMQDSRIKAELKVDRYRREAVQEMYKDKSTFDQSILQSTELKKQAARSPLGLTKKSAETLSAGDRLIYFSSVHLRPHAMIKGLIAKVRDQRDVALDIYVLEASTDQAIQQWAREMQLEPALLIKNSVTLNHDNGALAKLSTDNAKSQLFLKRGGRMYRVSEASI